MDFEALNEFLIQRRIRFKKGDKTAQYVSIKVGGIASFITFPNTIEKMCDIIRFVQGKYKYFILGNGTNCYFSNLYEGIVISTTELNKIYQDKNIIIADCGASLNDCAICAYESGLSGAEFVYGIPGSVGGGIYMNASAFGGMISQIVKECTVYDTFDNSILMLSHNEMEFGTKSSIFMKKRYVALSAKFELSHGDKQTIKSMMENYWQKREVSQPLDMPSAGSAFKRPINGYASQLIDDAGLKGFSIGGAQVSPKHAGFIVNKGNASAKDINQLLEEIKRIVKFKFDVGLDEEIIYVE